MGKNKGPDVADVAKYGRRDRLIEERVHDPYQTRRKLHEPSVCPECSALFQAGRWQWTTTPPDDAQEALCPACQRVRDRVPAGFLILSGEFFEQHRDEILNLIHNKVESEKAQHPLKRMMGIEEQENGVVITFTEIHLPRGVGEALQRAYEGDLDIQYADQTSLLRVYWRR